MWQQRTVWIECVIWELSNFICLSYSVFCATWMSQVQGFGGPKRSTRKRSVLSTLFWNLWFTRTNWRYRFFENGMTKERSRFAALSQADCSKVKTLVWISKSRVDWKHWKHECKKSKVLAIQVRAGGCKYVGWTISLSDALQYCLRLKTFPGSEKWWGRICQRQKVSYRNFIIPSFI